MESTSETSGATVEGTEFGLSLASSCRFNVILAIAYRSLAVSSRARSASHCCNTDALSTTETNFAGSRPPLTSKA